MFVFEEKNQIVEALGKIESFVIYINGEKTTVGAADEKFQYLFKSCCKLFSNSRIMPAFGVSLNSETQDAIKKDEWLEINFNETIIVNDLPFSGLLFKLEKTSGVNLIRKNNDRYEGRCIYLDFDEELNLKELFI